MKNLLLTVLAFGLVSSSSTFAQEEGLQKKQYTRVVASEAITRIGFFTGLNPDCTASGNVNIRVTKQPEHGSAETTTTTNFPGYPKENIRFKCNEHKVKGIQSIISRRRNTSATIHSTYLFSSPPGSLGKFIST